MTPFTIDDFSDRQWEQLCRARRFDPKGEWPRVLRELCGYTSGRHELRKNVETIVDAWLRTHPSWKGRYL